MSEASNTTIMKTDLGHAISRRCGIALLARLRDLRNPVKLDYEAIRSAVAMAVLPPVWLGCSDTGNIRLVPIKDECLKESADDSWLL